MSIAEPCLQGRRRDTLGNYAVSYQDAATRRGEPGPGMQIYPVKEERTGDLLGTAALGIHPAEDDQVAADHTDEQTLVMVD